MVIKRSNQVIRALLEKQVGIIPTDTIYGLATVYDNRRGVEKIFQIKKRLPIKKIPILVASIEQLQKFIIVNDAIKIYVLNCLKPTTVIYPLNTQLSFYQANPFFADKNIAIRFVRWEWLRQIILQTGPLAVTSCNVSGQKPINKFPELSVFASQVDFIVSKKPLCFEPSRVFDWKKKAYLR